jgi:U3 small nucleolar RNA-associated protein 10
MLREACCLIDSDLKLVPDVKTFLEALPYVMLTTNTDAYSSYRSDEERSGQSHTPKRQAHAILVFVRLALEQLSATNRSAPPERSTSSNLLASLLNLAVSKRGALTEASMEYISKTADSAVRDALSIMSAGDFIAGVLTVIETGEASVSQFPLSEDINN